MKAGILGSGEPEVDLEGDSERPEEGDLGDEAGPGHEPQGSPFLADAAVQDQIRGTRQRRSSAAGDRDEPRAPLSQGGQRDQQLAGLPRIGEGHHDIAGDDLSQGPVNALGGVEEGRGCTHR